MDRASLQKAYERLKSQKKNIAKKAEQGAEALFGAAEVGGTAFAAGYIRATMGENGKLELLGVDASLMGGIGLHGIAFFVSDKYATHLHNLGNGAFAEYTAMKGYQMGIESKSSTSGIVRELHPGGVRQNAPAQSAFAQAAHRQAA